MRAERCPGESDIRRRAFGLLKPGEKGRKLVLDHVGPRVLLLNPEAVRPLLYGQTFACPCTARGELATLGLTEHRI